MEADDKQKVQKLYESLLNQCESTAKKCTFIHSLSAGRKEREDLLSSSYVLFLKTAKKRQTRRRSLFFIGI